MAPTSNLLLPFLEAHEQAEYVAANFMINRRPLFNEAAYKLLINQGQQELADHLLYNKPETVQHDDPQGPRQLDPGGDRGLQRCLRRLGRRRVAGHSR